MTIGEVFAVVCSIVATLAAICTIVVFFTNRGKDKYNDGKHDESMKGDIKYMRNSFDDLRLDVKEVARKQDSQGERITRTEESVKQAHKRIDTLERKINHEEIES